MAHVFLNGLDWCRAKFLAAGFVSNSYGVAPSEEGMGQLVVTSLLGAFCGMIGGFLLSQIMRYFAMISGRNLGYHVWTLAGAALGAGIFLALGLRNVDN